MLVNLEPTARAALLNLGVTGIIVAGGGSVRVALFLGGVEVTGNGYSRKSTGGPSLAVNGVDATYVDLDAVTFTAVGGSIVYDQVRIFNRLGTILLAKTAITSPVTIAVGAPHSMTVRFQIPPAQSAPGVIDMRDFGRANDDDFDNTAGLLAALAERDSAGNKFQLSFLGGEWTFADALGINALDDLTIADCVSITGIPRGLSAQHEEEGGFSNNKQFTVFRLDMASEEFWWQQHRDYRFGPLFFSDICFRVINRGSVFDFDYEDGGSEAVQAARGIEFQRCYFSRVKHFLAADAGDGRAWLINEGVDGLCVNQNVRAWAIRGHRLYDARGDIAIRGFAIGLSHRKSDRLNFKVRTIFCGQSYLDLDTAGEAEKVASSIPDLWSENHVVSGFVNRSTISNVRTEINANDGVPPQICTMPSDISWSIALGASTVNFVFPRAKNCLDYFIPDHTYRFTPAEDVPTLDLHVTGVAATALTVDLADSTSYVRTALTGTGAGISREFGLGGMNVGDNAKLIARDQGGLIENIDELVCHPGLTAGQYVGNNSNGLTAYPSVRHEFRVAATNYGVTFGATAGIVAPRGAGTPQFHPLVNADLPYDTRFRPAIYPEIDNPQKILYTAGRGISAVANVSRDLSIRTRTPEFGTEPAYVYRPSDGTFGVQLRDARMTAGTASTLRIHAYRIGGAATINLWAGAVAVIQQVLGAGWGTYTLTIPAPNFVADGTGPYLQLTAANWEFDWAIWEPS